ncbi:MAG TPA: hypothetical protein VN238_04820 [Solirubrobacteraceae bacterium]|nr:hypothetical protein [Solirubrobacteraceae bacterium]
MRGPQGTAVAAERHDLEGSLQLVEADARTFALAGDAMERLAEHAAEAHRLPVPDLVTAALAHQHGCGVVHVEGHFDLLAAHGGLAFEVRRLELQADAVAPDG